MPSSAPSASPSRARGFRGRSSKRAGQLRLLAARAVHRGHEPPPDPADLGPLPLRLPGRCSTPSRRISPSASPPMPGRRRNTSCRACAGRISSRRSTRSPSSRFMGGEWGWAAPFRNTDEERHELRLALCAADIAAVKAIREVDPEARMVHIDPLILVVPPRDRPDLADEAAHETSRTRSTPGTCIAGTAPPGARRLAGDPRYRRGQLLLVRADGVPRAGPARRARRTTTAHPTAGRAARLRLGALPPADDRRRDQRSGRRPRRTG